MEKTTTKSKAPAKVTSTNSTVAKAVKPGSSSEKAGIIGYNSGGGAIYGAPGGQNYSPINQKSEYASAVKDTQAGFPSFASEQVDETGNVTSVEKMTTPQTPLPKQIPQAVTPPPQLQETTSPVKAEEAAMQPEVLSAAAPTPTQNKYKEGFERARNIPAPNTTGAGAALVSSFVKPEQQTTQAQQFIDQNPAITQMMQTYQGFMSPENQRKSLTDTYTELVKKSGIQQLDTNLMNMRAVIDGTEDDIRNEITKAGGFASESQVMSLAASRNKQLIKNYNQLLETRNSQQEYINTQISLAEKDRQDADSQFDRSFNFQTKMMDYRDKMLDNSRQMYQKVVDAKGYAGLQEMTGGDPYYTSMVERSLGLAPGGLNQLATMPPSEADTLSLDMKRADLALKKESLNTEKLQQQKIRSDISEISNNIAQSALNSGVIDEKTLNRVQGTPEYKTISGLTPVISSLQKYRQAIEKYGTAEVFGEGKGEKKATYGNAISAWKTLAGLGALSGADFGLAENVVPEGGKAFSSNKKQLKQLDVAIENAISQAEILSKRLIQTNPKAATLIEKQLDDAKVIAYPDKFGYAADGSGDVVELVEKKQENKE